MMRRKCRDPRSTSTVADRSAPAVAAALGSTATDGTGSRRRQSRIRRSVFLVAISASVAFGIGTAEADIRSGSEVLVDIYGGYSSTGDDAVFARRITTNFFFVTDESATRNVSYDPAFTVGGRVGTYFDHFGVALDLSYFEADAPSIQNTVFSISGLLMARAQLLKTDDMPRGRLQPYLAIGPGLFLVTHDVDFRPDISRPFDLRDTHIGVDARAGLRWMFSRHAGLLIEYRLTHFSADSVDDSIKINGQPTKRVNATLTTQHVLGGLTFSF